MIETYTIQSKSTVHSFLNVTEILGHNRGDMWNLGGCNGIRTFNHLLPKQTSNNLAKLTNWLSFFVSNYLCGAFDCIILSYHVRVSAWTHIP